MRPFEKNPGAVTGVGLTHEFVVEFFRSGDAMQPGDCIATARLDIDWDPAVQCAGFQAIRDENCLGLPGWNDCRGIQPQWHELLGPPYVDGATVLLKGEDWASSINVPFEFFKTAVRIAKQNEARKGFINDAETVVYRVSAFAKQMTRERPVADADGFSVESIGQSLKIGSASQADYLSQVQAVGRQSNHFPVYIFRSVIDQAVNHMIAAGAAEVGGIFLGDLFRDPETRNLFGVIRAQIFAHNAKSELTQLTFTAETWAEVDAAIRLRRRDESWLGWWHSHPARQWCSRCPVENRQDCKLSGEFFSLQDELFHRAVFPQAYAVALVISDSYSTGITWPMFGWHRGLITPREFCTMNENPNS